MKPKIGINKKTTVFLIVGMTGIFAMLLAPTLNAVPANAINDKWNCYNQQSGKTVGGSGPCPGNSVQSGPLQNQNPGGQVPPGQQQPKR